MWPCKDIIPDEYISKDYLQGFDEQKFRSTRLAIWYNVP